MKRKDKVSSGVSGELSRAEVSRVVAKLRVGWLGPDQGLRREGEKERESERERGKGEEIQKGGTEWRGRERDIVRRFSNKKELLPVIQYRQTDTTHFPPAASMHSSVTSVF